ncbi:HipA domain-containing protein [uncultured Adlercreutzia sp.]|uniref:HipA domain-containing protein n=1 Tax=uncultured Adlercreutzia sp. TaxID=875803 RepID=UPI0025E8F4CC|nr:HipA domain-containing protein [uncultured Adlercreutzia sp.]
MYLYVYRDMLGQPELVGSFGETDNGIYFWYDVRYVQRGEEKGEFGISESVPLDFGPYYPEEYAPFFQGLLPEGAVLGNLAERYQIPRNDFLGFFERLGCESIGALTFVAEGVDIADFKPRYVPLGKDAIERMQLDAEREVTEMTDELRLSLSGAQSKVAWYLPDDASAAMAELGQWCLPEGTAPSSHIVKVARKGKEELAYNEYVCMDIARRCGFSVPEVDLMPGLPGAIAVRRYDRVRLQEDGPLVRLHQEDFCQARGLPTYLKYSDAYEDVSYVEVISKLIGNVSANPLGDRLELARRLLFHYLIGNSDNHLKNYAFLYSPDWTSRSLAPLYDVTCIPLTGYSTKMAFPLGAHRELCETTAEDLAQMGREMGVSATSLRKCAQGLASDFAAINPAVYDEAPVADMASRIVENARPRLGVLREFAGD